MSITFKIKFFKNGLFIDIVLAKATFANYPSIFKTILLEVNSSSAITMENQSPHTATTTIAHSVILNLDNNHSFLDMPPL